MYKFLRTCLVILTLQGCAVFTETTPPQPKWGQVTVHISLTEDLPFYVNGRAGFKDGECYVELRKSIFPTCLPHELLHCFGWQHNQEPNQQYCRVE